jgi:hypothetical protein
MTPGRTKTTLKLKTCLSFLLSVRSRYDGLDAAHLKHAFGLNHFCIGAALGKQERQQVLQNRWIGGVTQEGAFSLDVNQILGL